MMRMVFRYINLLLVLLLVGCSDSSDSARQRVSIAFVKSLYEGYATPIRDDIAIRGVVTANSATENMRNTIIVEDNTAAIEIKCGYDGSAMLYPVGSYVEVCCQRLWLGGYGGVIELGGMSEDRKYQTSFLDRQELMAVMKVLDGEMCDVEPYVIEIPDLTPSAISRVVRINGLTVISSYDRWAANTDQIVNHTAIDEYGNTIVLRVYGYANFALDHIPDYKIDITGVIGYYNGYQIQPLTISRHR